MIKYKRTLKTIRNGGKFLVLKGGMRSITGKVEKVTLPATKKAPETEVEIQPLTDTEIDELLKNNPNFKSVFELNPNASKEAKKAARLAAKNAE